MKKKTTQPPEPIEDGGEITPEAYRLLLIELSNTIFWRVILMQSRAIDEMCIESLAAVDPFKDPTIVARTQGMRQGLFSLENEVNRILEDVKESEKKEEGKK